jgi:hypothetical protein
MTYISANYFQKFRRKTNIGIVISQEPGSLHRKCRRARALNSFVGVVKNIGIETIRPSTMEQALLMELVHCCGTIASPSRIALAVGSFSVSSPSFFYIFIFFFFSLKKPCVYVERSRRYEHV